MPFFENSVDGLTSGYYFKKSHELAQMCLTNAQKYKKDFIFFYTVKPVLSSHSKIDKTKVLKTNGSLMKVKSIAECSLGAFCNTFDLH